MNFCHGFSFGGKDLITTVGWFELGPLAEVLGVEAFRRQLIVVVVFVLWGGGLVLVSMSISSSGASRRTFAAFVNVVRALDDVGAAWFPARRGDFLGIFLGLFLRNISSREGRYGEDEDTEVGSKVRARGGDDRKTSVEDMARRM